MPTPAYITELRAVWGTRPLLLPGVSGVVFAADGYRILLQRRADTGRWSLPAGIVEPGEHPAACLLRELTEETGVTARIDRLALLTTDPPIAYPNGDRCQFVSMVFRCTHLAGEARVADEESLDVGWFALDDLPELSERNRRRVACATPVDAAAVLDR